MSGDDLNAALAAAGAVIAISTLLSGFIHRSALPQVAVFLLLGLALGPFGAGALVTGLDSATLRVVSTLSLALVLFTDAITLDLAEVRKHLRLVARILGPGTVLPAALIALAAWALLDLPPAAAAVLGAALASTDPVLLRGLVRRRDIPPEARLALRLESGLNDVVLLPVVIGAMLVLTHGGDAAARPVPWPQVALSLFVLGPLAGVVVGLVGIGLLDFVRKRSGIKRDYESIYSLGVAFAAFAVAESFHASGFLAAFAAGLTIVWLDMELCDCFVEYGETTGEMLLLFTFVLLGSGPIWLGLEALDLRMALFVLVALAVRPSIMLAALHGSALDARSSRLVAWFGPRGLSSILLVLLPLFAGIPGMQRLFEACAATVLASIAIHGGSLMWLARRGEPAAATAPSAEEPTAASAPRAPAPLPLVPVTAAQGEQPEMDTQDRITLDELARLEASGESVVLVDVRSARSVSESHEQLLGALRFDPEEPVAAARRLGLTSDRWIALYCS